MLKKVMLGIMVAFIFALAAFGVQAQDALTAGKAVEGELTEKAYAIEYTYKGKADEVIIVKLTPVDTFGDLNNPAIVVRDAKGTDLVRYDSYGKTTLVTQLPADGSYTIIATRQDDAAGTSVGKFTLELIQPQELAVGNSVEMEITSEETNYFVYRGDADFILAYMRDGDYAPEFTINTLDTDITPGSLDTVATVGGKLATQGAVGVIPGKTVYVIKVGQALFDFYYDTIDTKYTLQISEPSK